MDGLKGWGKWLKAQMQAGRTVMVVMMPGGKDRALMMVMTHDKSG